MTPVRPAKPEKTANPTTAPAGRPAAVPATRSTAREPAAAIPTIAPPSGDAGIASVAAALPPAALQRGGAAAPAPGSGPVDGSSAPACRCRQAPRRRRRQTRCQPLPAACRQPTPPASRRDNAVPADLGPQCSLERQDRRGSQISWSMSCANTGVRSEGLAQYRGDTMQAAVVSHIPGQPASYRHDPAPYRPLSRVMPARGHGSAAGRRVGAGNAAGSSQPPAAMAATPPTHSIGCLTRRGHSRTRARRTRARRPRARRRTAGREKPPRPHRRRSRQGPRPVAATDGTAGMRIGVSAPRPIRLRRVVRRRIVVRPAAQFGRRPLSADTCNLR